MRLLSFVLGRDTQKKTKPCNRCTCLCDCWYFIRKKSLVWECSLFFILGTRDSKKDWTILLLLFVLGRAAQQKTWLYYCCCLFWDARLNKKLGYETVVVCFGTRYSEVDLSVRLLLFVLGRATQKKTWLCDCCFDLGCASQNKTLAVWLLLFFWDTRLRRRRNYGTVVVLIFGNKTVIVFFWDARLRRYLGYETVVVCGLGMRLLLFVLGRATRKKTNLCNCYTRLCDCCFFLERATPNKTYLWNCCFSYFLGSRLSRSLS